MKKIKLPIIIGALFTMGLILFFVTRNNNGNARTTKEYIIIPNNNLKPVPKDQIPIFEDSPIDSMVYLEDSSKNQK